MYFSSGPPPSRNIFLWKREHFFDGLRDLFLSPTFRLGRSPFCRRRRRGTNANPLFCRSLPEADLNPPPPGSFFLLRLREMPNLYFLRLHLRFPLPPPSFSAFFFSPWFFPSETVHSTPLFFRSKTSFSHEVPYWFVFFERCSIVFRQNVPALNILFLKESMSPSLCTRSHGTPRLVLLPVSSVRTDLFLSSLKSSGHGAPVVPTIVLTGGLAEQPSPMSRVFSLIFFVPVPF